MEKFNSSTLFTGYLKQVLHNFNLPKIRVYTKEQQQYADHHAGTERYDVLETITKTNSKYPDNMRYIPYLKDGTIQEYIDGKWIDVGIRDNYKAHKYYNYGDKLLNYTKNLIIKNNVYDSYTHEYLGDYLRFQRDYCGINLMPLYNCFSNTACKNLYIKSTYISQIESYKPCANISNFVDSDYLDKYIFVDDKYVKIKNISDINEYGIAPGYTTAFEYFPAVTSEFVFDSNDTRYKIFMLPIKLFNTYTIALDSELPVELCCGIYGKYQDTREKFIEIPGLTYKKLSHCKFSFPILYTECLNLNQLALSNSIVELAQNESDLKLFIKVPANNTSTIIVLEGNYISWNDYLYTQAEPIIIDDVAYSGNGSPTITAGVSMGQKYLDIKNKKLYEYSSTGWKNAGNLWKTIESSYDLNYINQTESVLLVDNKEYVWSDFDSNKQPITKRLDEEKYFEYYLENNRNIPYAKNIAYYNSAIKKLFINNPNIWIKYSNYAELPLETLKYAEYDTSLITPLQLLMSNTGEQYPFANRLIEYLMENCITNREDEIPDNIKRVQKILKLDKNITSYDSKFNGAWDNRINKINYRYINKNNNTFGINHDILGYVDKDVEKNYTHRQSIKDPKTGKTIDKSVSLLNIELDKEE